MAPNAGIYNQKGRLSYPKGGFIIPKRVGYHAQKVGYHTQKGGLLYTIPIEPTHTTAGWETTAPAVFRMWEPFWPGQWPGEITAPDAME